MKWTKRFRVGRRDAAPRERVSWLGLIGVALSLFVIGFAYAYPRLTRGGLRDFDGRVVDKYVAVRESQIGSATLPRLVVETADGRRFQVGVGHEMHARARAGMWLSRRGGELTLSWDGPRPGAPRGDRDRFESR